jgi:hypothetical protein
MRSYLVHCELTAADQGVPSSLSESIIMSVVSHVASQTAAIGSHCAIALHDALQSK